jgi:hypothetical protein
MELNAYVNFAGKSEAFRFYEKHLGWEDRTHGQAR